MGQETAFGLIMVSLILVLLIGALKQRAQIILWFLVRMTLGNVGILCVNELLAAQGIPLAVGINLISFLTTGTLGFSGVALLYGILAIQFL